MEILYLYGCLLFYAFIYDNYGYWCYLLMLVHYLCYPFLKTFFKTFLKKHDLTINWFPIRFEPFKRNKVLRRLYHRIENVNKQYLALRAIAGFGYQSYSGVYFHKESEKESENTEEFFNKIENILD